jgi:hypothetical protein
LGDDAREEHGDDTYGGITDDEGDYSDHWSDVVSLEDYV